MKYDASVHTKLNTFRSFKLGLQKDSEIKYHGAHMAKPMNFKWELCIEDN